MGPGPGRGGSGKGTRGQGEWGGPEEDGKVMVPPPWASRDVSFVRREAGITGTNK